MEALDHTRANDLAYPYITERCTLDIPYKRELPLLMSKCKAASLQWFKVTPQPCSIHLGAPVVPEENIIYT